MCVGEPDSLGGGVLAPSVWASSCLTYPLLSRSAQLQFPVLTGIKVTADASFPLLIAAEFVSRSFCRCR